VNSKETTQQSTRIGSDCFETSKQRGKSRTMKSREKCTEVYPDYVRVRNLASLSWLGVHAHTWKNLGQPARSAKKGDTWSSVILTRRYSIRMHVRSFTRMIHQDERICCRKVRIYARSRHSRPSKVNTQYSGKCSQLETLARASQRCRPGSRRSSVEWWALWRESLS